MDFYGFYTGNEFKAYEYLGAHLENGGTVFRTFAPGARHIAVIGDFNGWTDTPMHKVYDGNFWECWIPEAKTGMKYKYRIYDQDGGCRDRCDPYGNYMELRPHSASMICDIRGFQFTDSRWMKKRSDHRDKPLNIYEIHMGSWRCRPKNVEDGQSDGRGEGNAMQAEASGPYQRYLSDHWYTYAEMAELLIPYLKKNHYNYVEVLPLAEHPCDESWGYQISGFFSPTSRYGTPDDLKTFVNRCHEEGIGVIMDFVPVHFAVDDYALWRYDGTALYEYPNNDVGKSEWGSCNFMHSRGEVRSFLQSSANYWLEEFHFDGLRMDAVSNLIYWQGNPDRGENKSAVQFLQNLNQGIKVRHPSAMLIAEDSTACPNITTPVFDGGLGFDYKWDMGWMNDTLDYFKALPEQRSERYHKLTFSMQYYYQERYLLPFSHDESVHGKATVLQKMSGQYEEKFPQARALYLYMYAHPGKKLNFMGNEIGQLREWDEKREQDWDIVEYPIHDAFRRFMKDLNEIYARYPALSEKDFDREGFEWRDCHQESRCIYAFERRGGGQRILAVFNFSDKLQEKYVLAVPEAKELIPLISSNADIYGGTERLSKKKMHVKNGQVEFSLPRFSGRYYLIERDGKNSNDMIK